MVRLIAKSKNIPGKNHIQAIQTLMICLITRFDQSQETVILPFLPCDEIIPTPSTEHIKLILIKTK
jgi:hypothetical protein